MTGLVKKDLYLSVSMFKSYVVVAAVFAKPSNRNLNSAQVLGTIKRNFNNPPLGIIFAAADNHIF